MSHASGYHLRDASQAYQITEQHLIATSSKDEIQCNYKNLERIKIEVITSYISPKTQELPELLECLLQLQREDKQELQRNGQ